MGAPNRLNPAHPDRGLHDPHAPGRKLSEVPVAPRPGRRSFIAVVLVLIALVLFGVAIFLARIKQSGPAKPGNANPKIAPPGMMVPGR